MKKIAFITCVIAIFIAISIGFYIDKRVSTEGLGTSSSYYKAAEGSVEELYQDISISFLTPYINKAVEDYYGHAYATDPWSIKVSDIKRPNGYRTFVFVIKLEISPYTGPHNSVGLDRITIQIKSGGNVKVESFEHIKTYELTKK